MHFFKLQTALLGSLASVTRVKLDGQIGIKLKKVTNDH